jgi:hypothetical protein
LGGFRLGLLSIGLCLGERVPLMGFFGRRKQRREFSGGRACINAVWEIGKKSA